MKRLNLNIFKLSIILVIFILFCNITLATSLKNLTYLYYKLNDNSSIIVDSTGIYNGSISATKAKYTNSGYINGGYDITADSGFITRTLPPPSRSYTVCGWAKSDINYTASQYHILFRWGDAGGSNTLQNMYLYLNMNGNMYFGIVTGNTQRGKSVGKPVDILKWNFYCVVADDDADLGRLYINNKSIDTVALSTTSPNLANQPFRIGARGASLNNEGMDGIADEVGIYNTKNVSIIGILYNSGEGLSYPFTVTTTTTSTTTSSTTTTTTSCDNYGTEQDWEITEECVKEDFTLNMDGYWLRIKNGGRLILKGISELIVGKINLSSDEPIKLNISSTTKLNITGI